MSKDNPTEITDLEPGDLYLWSGWIYQICGFADDIEEHCLVYWYGKSTRIYPVHKVLQRRPMKYLGNIQDKLHNFAEALRNIE